jgi:protein ImuB
MSFVCLWSPAWRTGVDSPGRDAPARPELAAALLARAPRIAIGERGVIWADAHGFPPTERMALAADLLTILARRGARDVRAGLADTPVAAELAAMCGREVLTVVEPGTDRAFVALFPLEALDPEPRLNTLLFGIGVATCGQLAALERESVEVRLGGDAVLLWRLARADDPRREGIFTPVPPELPHASLDWTEYALKDPARLLFVINALLERVCADLLADGQGARELTLAFSLTDRSTHREVLRAARPTANRHTWVRLVRTALDRVRLGAAVTGVLVRASRVAGSEAKQGDLFDRGLVSAQATEDAVARLIEDQGDVVVIPENNAHPLLDFRTTWVNRPAAAKAVRERPHNPAEAERERPAHSAEPQLLLQLAPAPEAIEVQTVPRRDHVVPVRYRDAAGWHDVVDAAGPDRVSGAQWDGDRTYAREYFRCVTREGALVWLFRDARKRKTGNWYFHGWWD